MSNFEDKANIAQIIYQELRKGDEMLRHLNRELYLWQGILIFSLIIFTITSTGFYYTKKIVDINSDPISKVDKEMMNLEKQLLKKPNPDGYVSLGKIYYEKEAPSDAKKAFFSALKLDSNHVEALYNLGFVYLQEKEYSKSQKYFEKVVKVNPDYNIAKYNLARTYIENDNFMDAEKLLIEVKDDFSTVADYFYYRGLVSEKLGNLQGAARFFEQAVKFDPEYQEARSGLARVAP